MAAATRISSSRLGAMALRARSALRLPGQRWQAAPFGTQLVWAGGSGAGDGGSAPPAAPGDDSPAGAGGVGGAGGASDVRASSPANAVALARGQRRCRRRPRRDGERGSLEASGSCACGSGSRALRRQGAAFGPSQPTRGNCVSPGRSPRPGLKPWPRCRHDSAARATERRPLWLLGVGGSPCRGKPCVCVCGLRRHRQRAGIDPRQAPWPHPPAPHTSRQRPPALLTPLCVLLARRTARPPRRPETPLPAAARAAATTTAPRSCPGVPRP